MKYSLLRIGMIFLGLLSGSAVPSHAELRAGVARVDITPDVTADHVPLGGYTARRDAGATGVHDAVYARALVLASGKIRIGIVSLDLCFVPASLKAEVLKRVAIAGLTDMDAAHVLIAATHTHTGPDPLAMHASNTFSMRGWTSFNAHLLDFTADHIAQAIVQAYGHMLPARIGTTTRDLTGWNRNRRGEKTVDPMMTLLKVTTEDGHALAGIVDFAAHPTLYDDKMLAISGDWPGAMTRQMEQNMGGDAVCLFLNGAEGDASPNGAIGETPDERVMQYGKALARQAWEVWPDITLQKDPPLNVWLQNVVLPPRKPNGLFVAAATQFGATLPQAQQVVNALMPASTTLHLVQIGDTLLIGFPCEPTAEIGLAAKTLARSSGWGKPAIIALTDAWLAYAVTPEQYHTGKYETGMSFYGDRIGPTLLEALKKALMVYPPHAAKVK